MHLCTYTSEDDVVLITAIMADKSQAHIPISVLWEYAHGVSAGEGEHAQHLQSCQECVAIIWLARTCDSLEDLRGKLKSRGIAHD